MTVVAALVVLFALSKVLLEKRDFAEYSPAALPKGASITTSDYYLLRNKSIFPSYLKHLNINLSLPNSWISEYKTYPYFEHTCQGNTGGEVCKVMTSPRGQQYQLVKAADTYANQTIYEVSFVKNDTAIWSTMRTTTGNFDNQDWGKFVDSFKPTSIRPNRTIHGSAQGP